MVLRVYTYFRKDGTCSVTQAAMATAEATDETWCNSGHTTSKSWMDTTIASSSQARREGLTTGNKLPSGKGGRVILVHAGNENGFIPGAELIFHGKKDDDYHDEMDGKMMLVYKNKNRLVSPRSERRKLYPKLLGGYMELRDLNMD
uniref:Uncharacterized protein n=1 Tax=Timema shepardi TaxID=629360 RepID=A0A7R9ALY0_TIMSH|nr:unnamed protein product [Timema shepardi]